MNYLLNNFLCFNKLFLSIVQSTEINIWVCVLAILLLALMSLVLNLFHYVINYFPNFCVIDDLNSVLTEDKLKPNLLPSMH